MPRQTESPIYYLIDPSEFYPDNPEDTPVETWDGILDWARLMQCGNPPDGYHCASVFYSAVHHRIPRGFPYRGSLDGVTAGCPVDADIFAFQFSGVSSLLDTVYLAAYAGFLCGEVQLPDTPAARAALVEYALRAASAPRYASVTECAPGTGFSRRYVFSYSPDGWDSYAISIKPSSTRGYRRIRLG